MCKYCLSYAKLHLHIDQGITISMPSAVPPQPVQSSKNPSARALFILLRKLKRRSTERERERREQDRILISSYLSSISSRTLHRCSWGISLGPDPGCVTGLALREPLPTPAEVLAPAGWSWMVSQVLFRSGCVGYVAVTAKKLLRQWSEQPLSGFADRRMPTTYITRSMDPASGSTTDVLVSHLSEG
jgi:hypothetical protein